MASDIQMTIRLERPVVPTTRDVELDIAVELNCTGLASPGAKEQPANLCLAIDCSGSMAGSKLTTAIECANRLAQQLRAADRLMVVSFADRAATVYNPELPRESAADRIHKLVAGGETDLSAGYRLALLEVQTHGERDSLNRVVLMTDGQATRGETKSSVLAAESLRASELGITTTCIGIGDDFAQELLYDMANASGGNFYWVQQDDIETIIAEESGRALATRFVNATLELILPDGVMLSVQSNKLRTVAPNIYRLPPIVAGGRTCYAYRLRVSSSNDPGKVIQGRIVMKHQVVATASSTLRFGSYQEYVASPIDDVVVMAREQFQLAVEDEQMMQLADSDDMDELQLRLGGVRGGMAEARAGMRDDMAVDIDSEIDELGHLQSVTDVLAALRGTSGDAALQHWVRSDVMPKLQKLMRHRASKHAHRGMGPTPEDAAMHGAIRSLRSELFAKATEVLRCAPEHTRLRDALRQLENDQVRE